MTKSLIWNMSVMVHVAFLCSQNLLRGNGMGVCSHNTSKDKIIWQFRTVDARVELVSLYPIILSASE